MPAPFLVLPGVKLKGYCMFKFSNILKIVTTMAENSNTRYYYLYRYCRYCHFRRTQATAEIRSAFAG